MRLTSFALIPLLCLGTIACTPLAGCAHSGASPAPTSIATIAQAAELDAMKAQLAARSLQATVDKAIIALHSSGGLKGDAFNSVKADALKADAILDSADRLISTAEGFLAAGQYAQAKATFDAVASDAASATHTLSDAQTSAASYGDH